MLAGNNWLCTILQKTTDNQLEILGAYKIFFYLLSPISFSNSFFRLSLLALLNQNEQVIIP